MHRSQSEFTTKELVQDNSLKTIDKLTIIDDRQRCRPFDSQHIVFFDLVYQIVGWRCWWVELVPFKEKEFLGIVSLKESYLLMLTLTDSWTCHCSICPCFLESELTSRFYRALKMKILWAGLQQSQRPPPVCLSAIKLSLQSRVSHITPFFELSLVLLTTHAIGLYEVTKKISAL